MGYGFQLIALNCYNWNRQMVMSELLGGSGRGYQRLDFDVNLYT